MKARISVTLTVVFHIVGAVALAQLQTFKVNPQASNVSFSLGDILHSVHGDFAIQSGTVEIDPARATISGLVIVAAGSGHSGNESRDKKMSKDILEAPRFNEATFVPHSYKGAISPSGSSTIEVTGVFNLHGSGHDLTVTMDLTIDDEKCTAKTHFTVPYVKWGLKDPSTFLLRVSKDVEVDLTLIGTLNPVR